MANSQPSNNNNRNEASSQNNKRSYRRKKNNKTKKTGQANDAPRTQQQQQSENTQQTMSFDLAPLERLLGQFDHSQVDDSFRSEIIEYLERLLRKWSESVKSQQGIQTGRVTNITSDEQRHSNPWNTAQPTVVSFGSYRLGVSREESDLDLLLVAPPCISKNDFFTSWVEFLQSQDRIERVHPIPEAYTPVLRMEIDSISVDMLFASLSDASRLQAFQHKQRVPTDKENRKGNTGAPISHVDTTSWGRMEYRITDADLCNQDEAGIRSLNGARVSQMLMDMVPDLKKYQIVLRAVKEWAVCKGIYSNVLGFLGGINWAIMVAWACRYHPQASTATPAELLVYFFYVFSAWVWPTPLLVEALRVEPPPGVKRMHFWNPMENRRDGLDLMPILTPAYPSMNSAYNVGPSQLSRIQAEFFNAWTAIEKQQFAEIFSPTDFFEKHNRILQVSIRASNDADFVLWFRWVESRLRFLLNNLETTEIHAVPLGRFYMRNFVEAGKQLSAGREALFFVAIESAIGEDLDKHLFPLTSDFLHKINSWEKRNNRTMTLAITRVSPSSLPACCFDDGDSDEWDVTTNHSTRFHEHDSHSGKITPQTSQGSVDDDSLVSDYSGFTNDFQTMKKCRVNTSAVPGL